MYDLRFKTEKANRKSKIVNLKFLLNFSGNNTNERISYRTGHGGMDSCVTAAIANTQYQLALLHVNYSQRTESRELKAFWDIASFYNIPEDRILISNIDYLRKIGGSSLTDLSINVQDAQLHSKEIPSSYVPFRNALF